MKRKTPILDGNGWISCWCYETQRQVNIKGELDRGSISQVLTVEKCNQEAVCPQVFTKYCLLGKKREGKITEDQENQKQW